MPLPIVGGAIVKVGGSVLTTVGVNAIFEVLAKLKLPRGKVKDVIIDKVIDYVFNQLTASASDAPETLKVIRIFEGIGSVSLALGSRARAVKVTVTGFPNGFGRRFTSTVPPGTTNALPNGAAALQTGLPNKFYFGGISFGGNIVINNDNGDPVVYPVGITEEQPLRWQNHIFNVPKTGKDYYATGCLLYLLPGISAIVDLIYVEDEPVQVAGTGGGNNPPSNDPPGDGFIFIDFDGDGVNDAGG